MAKVSHWGNLGRQIWRRGEFPRCVSQKTYKREETRPLRRQTMEKRLWQGIGKFCHGIFYAMTEEQSKGAQLKSMTKRMVSLLLALILALGLLPAGVLAAGETEVSDQNGLAAMTDGGSYLLTRDITLNDWNPIDFSGTLDGNGYTITLNGAPLFQNLSGTVKNLRLNGSVSVSKGSPGALACTMPKQDGVPGGSVINCWSGADVCGSGITSSAAGLVGNLQNGTIDSCLATGSYTKGRYGDGTYGIAGGGGTSGLYAPQVSGCWYVNGEKGVAKGNNHTCTQVAGSDYSAALAALNTFASKEGLLAWAIDETDGIPKPTRGAAADGEGTSGGEDSEKTELELLIEQAEGLQEQAYAPGSWLDLQGILSYAKTVQPNQADEAARRLRTVMEHLITADSYGKLKEEYHSYETNYLPHYQNFTSESWRAVSSAAGSAGNILYTIESAAKDSWVDNSDYKDEDVLKASQSLSTAIASLQEIALVEIATLADLQSIDGTKQYALTADLTLPEDWASTITLSGSFQGNGHVITMSGGGPLFQDIRGTVRNLGITGEVKGSGAFAHWLSDGTIFNCYSWANVDNGTDPAGGVVGSSRGTYGGTISNTYVSGTVTGNPAGGLAGAVTYYDFRSAYWVNGEIVSSKEEEVETDALAGTRKTQEEITSDAFRAALNSGKGTSGLSWTRSEHGMPYFGQNVTTSGALPYAVKFADILDSSAVTVIRDQSQTLTTDVFGNANGYIGVLSLEDYEGQVQWTAASESSVVNEPVIIASDGRVFVRAPGSVKVTARGEDGEELLSFPMDVVVPTFSLTMFVNAADYTDKTYDAEGYENFTIVPYVSVDGHAPVPAYYGLFDWQSSAESVATVTSAGGVNIKAAGMSELTVSLQGVQAHMTLNVSYVPVTGITGSFSGTYYLHRRNPNSIGQTDFAGADFNPLRNLDSNGEEILTSQYRYAAVAPSNATYQTSTITSDNDDVIRFVAGTLQCMVPRKAGTAHLTVTSKDPNLAAPLTDTTQVTLEYLNPVQDLQAEHTTLTVKEGDVINAGLRFTGAHDNTWPEKYPDGLHVSESDMTWTQSGDGQVLAYRSYPIYMPGDEGYSLAEGSVANDQWLIKGVKAGTVTLTGTAKDSTTGTHTVTLTIHVEAGEQGAGLPVKEQVSRALHNTGDYVYQAVGTPAFNHEWMILGLARSGYAVSENFYETYYASVYDKIQAQKGETSRPWDNKVTETQRLALALTAVGKDPTDVGGVNLLDYTWNKETYFGQGNSLGKLQGSNELIFGLLALEASSTFSQPASVTMTAEAMVDTLLSDYQTPSGGFGLTDNQTAGADITAMALQGLAKHADEPAVSAAIPQALDYLSSVQGIDGTFGNAETTAQVVVALCELNMDPDQTEAFTKNGCSVVDGLLSFALEDGSFCHTMTGGTNGMATEQAFYALAALDRFYNGQNSLYRMDDVTLGGESGSAVTGVTVAPASAEVEAGQTVQLTATVVPVSAENKAVTWKSSNPEVASVSSTGLVSGQKAGTAQITVTTEEGGKTAVCQVTVRDPETPPPGETATVTLSVDKLTIDKGYVLEPTVVEITVGETVWEVFQREMEKRGISLTYTFHTQYNSVYVESIAGDGEFDHGPGSGWKYCVNGVYPDYGCSLYTLSGGEVIQWRYTTNLGADLEGDAGGETEKPTGSAVLKPEIRPDQNGSAQVPVTDLQLEAAISGVLAGGGDIVLAPQISGAASEVAAQLPAQGLKTMVEQTKAALVFQTELGDIALSHAVLSSLTAQAKGRTVRIALTARSAKDVADHVDNALLEGAAIVEVTITCDGKPITTFGGNPLTIALPVSWADHVAGETYQCVVVSEDGTTEAASGICSKERGRLVVTLKTSHLSTFVATTKPAGGQESTLPFSDVAGHWALDAIVYVWDKGLMNGTGKETFSPDSTMTRAMMVTILYRMAGAPAASAAQPFSDVPEGTWYTQAVSWAASQGIVDGVGEGRFSPDTAVTREQMAAMFFRYGAWAKLDVRQTSDLSGFADCQDVSAWALDAMGWTNAVGLITGRTDNRLAPKGTASRGEAATVLMRFAELGA